MQLEDFLDKLDGVTYVEPNKYMACCPVHGDKHPSMSVTVKDVKGTEKILLHCFAKCKTADILDKMGLGPQDLIVNPTPQRGFSGAQKSRGQRKLVARYDYLDQDGHFLFQKTRFQWEDGKKEFAWSHKDSSGQWVKGRGGEAVLFNLPVLNTTDLVYLVEGEKDVLTLQHHGKPAVSLPDGANSKWLPSFTEALRGKKVVILQDNDDPGKACAARCANALYGTAASVKVLDLTKEWDNLAPHGDISDVLAAHKPADVFDALAALELLTPEWQPVEEPPQPAENSLSVISAVELQQKEIPPARFVVVDFLPQGLSLLASPPKYGKSWFVLDLCLSVAAGTPFLGRDTVKSGCLYLALEDSQRRLQDRMNKVLDGKTAPQGFYFATSALDIGEGLLEQLENHMAAHPDTGLIVIDTLQKVRGAANSKENAYSADYREVGALKAFADKHGVCLLLVHHLRKMADDSDPFNRISGTNGIMGAADSVFVLSRKKRSDTQTTLSITGRDIESLEIVLEFDKGNYHWQVLGSVEQMEEQQARTEYESSYIPGTIRELVEQNGGRWTGTMQDLMDVAKRYHGVLLADNTKALSNKVKQFERSLLEYDGILHDRARNGNGGGKHRFYKRQLSVTETQPQGDQLSI